LPFAASIAQREESPTVDARLINGYLEQGEDKTLYAYRRPGVTVFQAGDGARGGRGCFNWKGDVYEIFGNRFYKNGTFTGFTTTDNGKLFSFSSALGATPKLFMHNGSFGYNWDGANLVTLVAPSTITVTGNVTLGSSVVTSVSPNTTGLTAQTGIVGNGGVPAGSYIVSVDSSSQFTMNALATASLTGVTFTCTTPGFPTPLVPGVAYLDSTTYVMNSSARIYGSQINDTSTTGWDATNNLIAQIEPDGGVCLAKQLVYVVAFKEWSTEFFYDADQPAGSPLGTVQGNKISQGCRAAGSVAESEGALLWIATTRQGNVSVWMIDAARGTQISREPVERLLQDADFTTTWAYAIHISGHRFYVVTVKNANLTLVYDLTTQEWYRWTDPSGNYLPFVSATFGANQTILLQHESNGGMYQMSALQYTDAGAIIPWDLYTPNWDGGTRTKKVLMRMDFISDQTPGTILQVRRSDDDYHSWSNYRTVDLGKKRPHLRDCGTFRRRAYHFSNRTSTFLRIQAVELEVLQSSS
jgi:hypothetical protein